MLLRWYQEEAVTSLFDYFRTGRGNPIVALPTGTGKSIVIAKFLYDVFANWPYQRVMMLTHVKELIEQNAKELLNFWPTAPLGIYSDGLKQRDIMLPIIFGGIASVKSQTQIFGHRDLVVIDECHLLSPKEDSMYQKVIKELSAINPYLKVIGLTATTYRLRQGKLTDEGLFTDICYDMTGVAAFNRLIAEGYMSPLIPKPTRTKIDTSNLSIQGDDYNKTQVERIVDTDEITYAAVKEMVEEGFDRKAWLVFSAGIANAEHIAAMLQSFGISAAATHSKLSTDENNRRINSFRQGELRALVNNNKLTTGFNHPPIDLIGMLRPTISPGLHVQMAGRGTRPSPETGKTNCKYLDFAGNVRRLGPINDPVMPNKAGKGTGDVPIKICEFCGVYNHISARICCSCGKPFQFENKLFRTARTEEIIKSDQPVLELFNVDRVIYNLHEKKNSQNILISPPTIKVSYFCRSQMFNEWICLEHPGWPGKHARDWWRQRAGTEPPATTYEALQKCGQLRKPARIRVHTNKQYPEIVGYEY